MLRESMQSRPNIYQALKEACDMQGRKVPIHDVSSLVLGKSFFLN
jgi:AP2-associated kinase